MQALKPRQIVLFAIALASLLLGNAALAAETPVAEPDDANTATDSEPLPIEMKTDLKNHEVYPGDPIRLDIVFTSDKPFGAEVLGSLDFGDFELKHRDRRRSELDGKQVFRHSFDLLNFKPGVYTVPAIPFVLSQNGKQQEVKSDRVRVKVKSLLEEEAAKIARQQMIDKQGGQAQKGSTGGAKIVQPGANAPGGPTLNLPAGQTPQGAAPAAPGMQPQPGGPEPQQVKLAPRDIKRPVPVIREDYTLLYVLGGFLALLIIGAGVFWWFKRERKTEEEGVIDPRDLRPAHVIALEKLAELEREQLIAKRRIKRFHLRLSEIVREYFERRYNLQEALSMTSSEIARRLSSLYLRDLDDRVVNELLSACDMVLFARDEPDDEACYKRLQQARLIVERTKEESGRDVS